MTLAKMPVEVVVPGGWSVLAAQSDESEGLVALAPEDDGEGARTAFLDGSQVVRVPESSAQATAEALSRDACAKPSACAVLGTETVPGGYLVSLRTPVAVAVESWRSASARRAVRCGFEVSALRSPAARGATWLDDADAVARARKQGEDFCRSVRSTP